MFSAKVQLEILSSIKEYGLEDMNIAQPGRFIAANSLSYIANVLYKHKKVRKKYAITL